MSSSLVARALSLTGARPRTRLLAVFMAEYSAETNREQFLRKDDLARFSGIKSLAKLWEALDLLQEAGFLAWYSPTDSGVKYRLGGKAS